MRNFEKVVIIYNFIPDFSLKIGAGYGKYGIVANAVRARTIVKQNVHETLHYVPASSVKGKIRATMKQFSHVLSEQASEMEKKIFGYEGESGWAHFSDLIPKSLSTMKVKYQTSTSIDRFRKTAKQYSLRVEEYLEFNGNNNRETELVGTIEGYRERDVVYGNKSIFESRRAELATLLFSLLQTKQLGADRSTGFGVGEMKVRSICINNKEIIQNGQIDTSCFAECINVSTSLVDINTFLYETLR